MKATFVAFDPAFKPNKKIREFENVNIYPTVTEILDLKITNHIDGMDKTAKEILIKLKNPAELNSTGFYKVFEKFSSSKTAYQLQIGT